MARHYSVRSFFRQTPNALLARYFSDRGCLADLDFSALKEAASDELFDAWMGLPESVRKEMDAQFREVYALSCDKGFQAILDELAWRLGADPDVFAALVARYSVLPNHYHRAMSAFLEYPECWRGATLFYHADTLPYWRKRKNMGHALAAVDVDSIRRLAEGIRTYFRTVEGRGNNCVVEPYRRGDLDYFFAYPEDYSRQSVEWVDGEFDVRPHNPAFEVVFVYSQKDGTLDVNLPGPKKALEPLQGIFAESILKLGGLPPDPEDTRVYQLNCLRDRDFRFVYDPASGIERVTVRKLRLSARVGDRHRLILEAGDTGDPDAIYGLMDTLGRAVPLHLYDVTQVELGVLVSEVAGARPRRVTVRITHPQSCSLKYDERDLKLRAMLVDSGLEPREPEQPVARSP